MSDRSLDAAGRSLLAGNFAIGCGVMSVAGALNDIVSGLQVPVAVAGQLIALAALVMALGAPTLAAVLGRLDRRRLLAGALAWFAAGHALSALAPDFATLLPVRTLTVVAAAVYTPQAAATMGALSPAPERGRRITQVFLGWSLASVLGMPLASAIGAAAGWRWAFAAAAVLSAAAAVAVWRTLPDGVRTPAVPLAAWRQIATTPALVGLVGVTALAAAGQFSLLSYLAPFFEQGLRAGPQAQSLLFLCFGVFGLLGNVVLMRWIDRVGAARSVAIALGLVLCGTALWPLPATPAAMVFVLLPLGLGSFAWGSAQQARKSEAARALAPALLALNTSAIYLGQAVGTASGGVLLATAGYGALSWFASGCVISALGLSAWVARR